jgi:hypothetical protein
MTSTIKTLPGGAIESLKMLAGGHFNVLTFRRFNEESND